MYHDFKKRKGKKSPFRACRMIMQRLCLIIHKTSSGSSMCIQQYRRGTHTVIGSNTRNLTQPNLPIHKKHKQNKSDLTHLSQDSVVPKNTKPQNHTQTHTTQPTQTPKQKKRLGLG